MKVMAAKGMNCPVEGKARQYITDDKPVDVKASPYYLRLVRDGSLIIETPKEEPKGKGKIDHGL